MLFTTFSPSPFAEIPDGPKPVAFISHSHGDSQFASKIAMDCRSRNINVWLDVLDMPDYLKKLQLENKLAELHQNLGHGILRSDAMIVVVSSKTTKSNWIKLELRIARHKGLAIIPLLKEPCEIPLTDADDRLLTKILAERNETEPKEQPSLKLPMAQEQLFSWPLEGLSGEWGSLAGEIMLRRIVDANGERLPSSIDEIVPDGYIDFIEEEKYSVSFEILCKVLKYVRS